MQENIIVIKKTTNSLPQREAWTPDQKAIPAIPARPGQYQPDLQPLIQTSIITMTAYQLSEYLQ